MTFNPCPVESDEESSSEDDEDTPLSVWDSVLVIKKEGRPDKGVADVSGVIAAARNNGASKRFARAEHVFGFTCTEWQFDAEDALYKDLAEEKRQECGFMTAETARSIIEA